MNYEKVYFACSIRGGGDKSRYPALIEAIQENATLLTEVFVADGLRPEGGPLPPRDIWQRDMAWVTEADLIIAEVSNPSLGVGYEIAKAEEMGKPILALYCGEKALSAMIAGSERVQVVDYRQTDEAVTAITNFISTS